MEKSCQSIGEGASAVGLSAWGIRNHYKTLSLKDGVAQSFKDSTNLVREIIRTRSIPRERTVVLMTTSNKDKIRDLSTYLERENPKGQVRLISLTDDPTKTQLSVRGLPADESTLGSTYETISSGKAAYHSPKELLTGRLQNMDDPFLNGRTLAEAFPGRRIVVVADDSGFGMKLGPEKLSAFGDQLKKRFGMPEDQVETFIRGLDITDDSVQLLGAKTHRNLETLANHLPLKDGKPDKFGAEQLLAEIMQEINLGGGFEFNSAVSARDIFSGHAPKTNLRTTRGQITNEPSAIGVDITDSCPLPEVVKVIDEAGGLNGVKLSQAPREQLSRSQAAEATLANIAQQAARDRVINLANGGAILEHLLEHLTDQ
jgi:hypothetical protein